MRGGPSRPCLLYEWAHSSGPLMPRGPDGAIKGKASPGSSKTVRIALDGSDRLLRESSTALGTCKSCHRPFVRARIRKGRLRPAVRCAYKQAKVRIRITTGNRVERTFSP